MEKQDFRKVQMNTFPAILPGLQHCPGTGGSGSGHPKIRGQTPCVVTDVDDTLILHPDYWGSMIATKHDAFDDPMWDEHIKQDKLTTAPGAVDFLNYCKSKGVDVFYVTSRDQGEGTYGYALKNLQDLQFPYADKDHLTVLIDTSNKEKEQKKIAQTHNIAVYLGDSLNDFQRVYYVKDVDQRNDLMEKDKDLFGKNSS